MRRVAIAVLMGVTVGACGGGGSAADESAFMEWYRQNEDRRMEVLEGAENIVDPEVLRHSQAEGLAEARATCGELAEAASGDAVANRSLSVQMENSLTGRYFVDAAIRWVCPGREGVVDRLIEEGTVDQRQKCEEVPEAIGCGGNGLDPLDSN